MPRFVPAPVSDGHDDGPGRFVPAKGQATVVVRSKKQGGGLLHGLGHVASQTGSDLKDAALNAPGGLVAAGGAVGADVVHAVSDAAAAATGQPSRFNPNRETAGEETRKKIVEPAIASYKEEARHPLRHPGFTALDLLAVATAGAGGVARLGAAGKALRAGGDVAKSERAARVAEALATKPKPGPRVLRVNDAEIRGHYSRSALSRGVQKAADATLQKAATKSVRAENVLHRRAAKWEGRNQRVADATARAPGTRLAVLGKKLKPHELRALRLVAEEVPVGRRLGAQEMRAARATGKEVGRHQERIQVTKAAMTHLAEGPEGKPVLKPGSRLNKVYDALKAASTDRESMLKNLGLMDEASQQAAKTKVGRIAAGAEYVKPTAAKLGVASDPLKRQRAYVAKLEGLHARALAKADEKAVPYGNIHARTALRKQTLKTAPEAAYRKKYVEAAPGPKTPGVPSAMPAKSATTYATDRVGASLSRERDKLARMEAAAAARVKPTGIVGAADITVSPEAPFIGNPVERGRLRGKPKVSSGGTFGHTPKPSSLKTSTGASVEHALERNDVTNIVAERHAEAVRLGTIDRTTQRLAKAGEKAPRRADDVWVWTDKTVSSERIPAEVRKYLDNPESLAASTERQRNDILSKLKDATFERHDWHADPAARSEFEKLAAQGKGVFVPRRLMGNLAKREYNVGHVPVVDEINNAQKAALIYLKGSYPIAQAISNTGMNLIQQGFAFPRNITAAIRLEKRIGPGGAAVVDDIMGGGAVLQAAFEGQGTIARGTQALAHAASGTVDTPARRAAFLHEAVKAGYNTAPKWKQLINDPRRAGDLAEVAQRAKEAIVDYGDLSPFERNVIRRLIFVYPWQKGATKYAGHFLRDHPVQAAALGQLAQVGKQQSDQTFGPLPTYLQGLIPMSGGAVNPSSINQFQTPAQIGEAAAGLLSGNPATAGQGQGFLAPAPALAVALMTNRDDLGFKLKGNLATKLRDTLIAPAPLAAAGRAAFPNSAAVAKVLGDRGPSKSFPGKNDALYRLLYGGLYPRQYNRAALNQNAARQKSGR